MTTTAKAKDLTRIADRVVTYAKKRSMDPVMTTIRFVQRYREMDIERDRERVRERDRERDGERERERHRETESERDRE